MRFSISEGLSHVLITSSVFTCDPLKPNVLAVSELEVQVRKFPIRLTSNDFLSMWSVEQRRQFEKLNSLSDFMQLYNVSQAEVSPPVLTS